MPRRRASMLAIALALAALALPAAHGATALAAPYVDTPSALVDRMLELGGVGPADFVVDLGSGDGRLVIAAVSTYKARGGLGVEIDPALVERATRNAKEAGVADRVQFRVEDLFTADVGRATVVTVYLTPAVMGKVEAKLRAELKPGTRVVVHDYPFPTWQPVRVVETESLDKIKSTGSAFTQLWLYVR